MAEPAHPSNLRARMLLLQAVATPLIILAIVAVVTAWLLLQIPAVPHPEIREVSRGIALGSLVLLGGAGLLISALTYNSLRRLAARYRAGLDTMQLQAAELTEGRERLAGIIGSAMDAIISINEKQQIILFNQAAERMFGVKASEALGAPLDRFIPIRWRDKHRHDVSAFGKTGVTARAMTALGQLTALRSDGLEFPIEAAISQVHTNGQHIYTVILRDITERLRAQEAIQRANETLGSLLRASPLPIIAVDKEAKVTLWNPAAERLFGWRQDEVLGRELPHVPESEHEAARDVLRRSLSGESLADVQLVRQTKDKRLIDVSLAAAPLRDATGQIIGMIGVSTDVRERKRAEEELRAAKDAAEAASRAKDQFLAVLSHELRTPLTPVLSLVDALAHRHDLRAELREDLVLIQRNVELEARLIDDLLDLTRIVKGKLRLRPEVVDIHETIRNALETTRPDATAKGLAVHVDLAAKRRFVRGDPARLQQIFWNLVKNAVKFTPASGKVSVRTADAEHDAIRIEVQDTGVGIAPEALGRIFDAFEQGEQSITRQFGGLGLGLSISRMLVERHHGTIRAASEGKGKGATFVVTLPTVEAPVAAPARPPSAPGTPAQDLRGLRILLVEDHEDTAKVMARLLRSLGYDVTTAGTVQTALTLAGSKPFDLVISDIGLPDGSGVTLMSQLRDRFKLGGIALSGFGMDSDIRQAQDAGFREHLTKPVDIGTLDSAIRGVVGRGDGG